MGADLEKLDSAPAKPGVEDPPSDTAKESLELGFLDDDEELEKEEQQDDETTTPRGSNHRAAWDKIEPFGDAAPYRYWLTSIRLRSRSLNWTDSMFPRAPLRWIGLQGREGPGRPYSVCPRSAHVVIHYYPFPWCSLLTKSRCAGNYAIGVARKCRKLLRGIRSALPPFPGCRVLVLRRGCNV